MELILGHHEKMEIYIDNQAVFSDNWTPHRSSLEEILTILQDKGFTINPEKCKWGVQETKFPRHWLTPTGVKPLKKKIDTIL